MSLRLPGLTSYRRLGHLKPLADFLAGKQPTASDVIAYAKHLHPTEIPADPDEQLLNQDELAEWADLMLPGYTTPPKEP